MNTRLEPDRMGRLLAAVELEIKTIIPTSSLLSSLKVFRMEILLGLPWHPFGPPPVRYILYEAASIALVV